MLLKMNLFHPVSISLRLALLMRNFYAFSASLASKPGTMLRGKRGIEVRCDQLTFWISPSQFRSIPTANPIQGWFWYIQ
jgi:hypothetical protein